MALAKFINGTMPLQWGAQTGTLTSISALKGVLPASSMIDPTAPLSETWTRPHSFCWVARYNLSHKGCRVGLLSRSKVKVKCH